MEAVLPLVTPLISSKKENKPSHENFLRMDKEKKAIRETLARTQHDTALEALNSGDPARALEGVTNANAYLQGLVWTGLSEADLPLIKALFSTPVDPRHNTMNALKETPLPVVYSVGEILLDELIEIGDGPMDADRRTRFGAILRFVGGRPEGFVAQNLDRIDALVATKRGRSLGDGLTKLRGELGPEQAPAILAYLDARTADGERMEGLRVALAGLCHMGAAGIPFLDQLAERKPSLISWDSTADTLMFMGLDDDSILEHPLFSRDTSKEFRAKLSAHLKRKRPKVEQDMEHAKSDPRRSIARGKCR